MRYVTRLSCPAAIVITVILGVAADPSLASAQGPAGGLKDAARAFARRQVEASLRAMNRPFPAFRIIGNIDYVGAANTAVYLIATPEGHILVNSGFDETVPLIRESMKKLGFRIEDVKLLLANHAHLDHAGGHAAIRRITGARIVMSRADAELLARGGRGDFLPTAEDLVDYPPARADRIIADGDTVSLGGVVLTAHLTPGHTQGCTTWTMTVDDEQGVRRDVVVYGGTTVLVGVSLVDNPKYPAIAEDYERTFALLEKLPCDVFLAPHGTHFDLAAKRRRLEAGERPNPFIDPEGYRAFVKAGRESFRRQLARERPGAAKRKADALRPSKAP
ncbi:MAG: subclass B3 metallo-beta-lactamase [Isosphaeraceae bacterium]